MPVTRRRTDRIAGASRVDTAIAVSRRAFPDGATDVFLARADDPGDAVIAATLGTGPVLLVPPQSAQTGPVAAEIARLDPERVTAVGGGGGGGGGGVSDEVLAALADGRPTDRISGASAVETAIAVSRRAFPDGATEVFLARADDPGDALVAATLQTGPVLLVPRELPVPDEVSAEVARLDPESVTAIGGPGAVPTAVLVAVAGGEDPDCGDPFVRDLGPAVTGAPVVTGAFAGGRIFMVTRNLAPTVLGAFDPETGRVTGTVELPLGDGAWASTVAGDGDLFVGTYSPAVLYRVGVDDLRVSVAARLEDTDQISSLATAPDGTVFLGTLPDGTVRRFDPATGRLEDLGPAVPGEYAVRSIAADADTIYAGVGSRAHLVAIDRRTGERRQLLPAELSAETFVYTLRLSERWLVAGTEPSGRLVVMPLDDLQAARVLPELGERTVDAIAIEGDDVWFTGRTTGTLYHYDAAADVLRPLAVPVVGEETRALFHRDGRLVGVGGSGVVWIVDAATAQVEQTNLLEAGFPGGAELVQSMLAAAAVAGDPTRDEDPQPVSAGRVYVGGHWGVQIHGAPAGYPERLRVPGEPKAMVEAAGALYVALYPGGEIWRCDPADGTAERAVVIGAEQPRPRAADRDAKGRVIVTSQAEYGRRGGALAIYDPGTGATSVHRDVVAGHGLRSLAVDRLTAYVGSELRAGAGIPPAEGSARLAAWDLDADAALWDLVPVVGARAVMGLVVAHGLVYGLTLEGVVFLVSPDSRQVLRTVELGATGRALVHGPGGLFATTAAGLHRLDLDTLTGTVVLGGDDLVHLAAGDGCALYVNRARRLVYVNP